MKINFQSHKIRYSPKANDIYYTPEDLAKVCISKIPFTNSDIVLDPCAGKNAFYNNFPIFIKNKIRLEITEDKNFFTYGKEVDWCISNPPYSLINPWLEHTLNISRIGFGYLIGQYSLTPKRLKKCEDAGFFLRSMHLCKVSQWFGMTIFVVFMKKTANDKIKFTYDKKVYQADTKEIKEQKNKIKELSKKNALNFWT